MLTLRPIRPEDNAAVKHVIHTVMPEFNCIGEGFSIEDPEVEDMYAGYAGSRSAFYVVEQDGVVVGGAGFAPLTGGAASTCELRKMYILPEGRGQGGGKLLLEACLAGAQAAGFTEMYLETVTAMADAAALYQKNGFRYLDAPRGGTGHCGCDRFMLRAL